MHISNDKLLEYLFECSNLSFTTTEAVNKLKLFLKLLIFYCN